MTVSFKNVALDLPSRGSKLAAATLLAAGLCSTQTLLAQGAGTDGAGVDGGAGANTGAATGGTGTEGSNSPATKSEPYYNVLGEGKTLPAGVARIRVPIRSVTGDFGYDKNGNKVEQGFTVKALGTALVYEHGVSDKLSLQFLAPYVISNEVGMDTTEFRKSKVYKEKTGAFLTGIASQLKGAGLCATDADCANLIEGGFAFPQDTTIPLPSGETMTAKAGVPVKAYADSLVANAAKPEAGEAGLGDIQVGLLYGIVTEGPLHVSAGVGLRFPTGKFTDVPTSKRATGRGTTDFGLRTNVDYYVDPGFIISWQNQAEVMIAKGKKKDSGVLDPTQTIGKEKDWEREGVRNVGFVKAAAGLGMITQTLAPLGAWVSYDYDADGETRIDGTTYAARSSFSTVTPGIGLSGFPYSVPVTVDFEYSIPVSGKNISIAQNTFATTIKAYYRF